MTKSKILRTFVSCIIILALVIVPAVPVPRSEASAAAIGLSVTFSMFISCMLNDMTGGQGYDIRDAISDLIEMNIENSMQNGEYIVKGVQALGEEAIDSAISAIDGFNNFIGTCFEGYQPHDVVNYTVNAINDAILRGDLQITIDDYGNLSVLGTE